MTSLAEERDHERASSAPSNSAALLRVAAKLLLVFGVALAASLALCALLLRRVRAADAELGLGTTRLDSLSLRSLSSLEELQHSHQTLRHVFAAEFPLALLCFACLYVLKQTFAIPGSALLNVFAGATLPLSVAFPLVSVLTACGASCCFLLSRSLASEQVVHGVCERVLPGKLGALRKRIEDARERGQLPFLLLFLRVFPFSPNWFLNLASPWLQVPLQLFAPCVCVGLLPYNFITVHAGAMLSQLTSTSELLDPRTVGSLVLLAVGMLVPAVLKKKQAQRENEKTKMDGTQAHPEVCESSKKLD